MVSARPSTARRLGLLLLAGAASIPLLPSESPACSNAGPISLQLRDAASAEEGEAPGPVRVGEVAITRGRGPESTGCGKEMSTSCDDLGTVTIELDVDDPDSPADEVGYVIEVVRGTPPDGLGLDVGPLRPMDGHEGSLTFTWIDEPTDEQEPLDLEVTIRAIDVDGHVGPVSEPIAITDPGR